MPGAYKWGGVLLLVVLGMLALFSVAGYITAGSLQGPGYRTAAWVYLGLLALSLAGIVGVLVWRGRRKDVARPVIQRALQLTRALRNGGYAARL